MSKKIIVLIVASIIGLIALSCIQGYLIKNTYSLKKEAFIDKTNKALDNIDDHGSPIDSIYNTISEKFINDLDRYSLKKINKEKLLERLQVVADSLNPSFIKAYEKYKKEKKLAYNLKFHKVLKNIVLVYSTHRDTVFKENTQKKHRLIGYDFKSDPGLLVGNSTSETERTFKEKINNIEESVSYRVYFNSENYINIDDWKSIVFNQMKGLLLFSFLIFLLVIGILYYSIKNLITQKKIADIKTDFVNNITHELKTPLATLSLATKILKKKEEIQQSDSTKMTVETIERQQVKLQKLIDQVLNNSLGYNDIILKKENVSLITYLNTVLDDFEISINKDIILERVFNKIDKIIEIDTFYLTTALINILENAVKYKGINIEVALAINNHALEISIKDNGIGIDKKDQKLLFEKFYRANNKDIHDVKGLGLGLYYSNQIIKAHQGTLTVASEKNKETIFSIKLPII